MEHGTSKTSNEDSYMPSSLPEEPSGRTSRKRSGIQTLQPILFSGFHEKGPVKSSKLFLMHTKAEWFLRISNFPTIINWAETLTRLLETTKQLQKNRDLLLLPVWIEFNC